MEQLLTFLYANWFKVLLALWLIVMLVSLGREWFKEQFGWLKRIFEEETGKPSSRRAIEVAVVWVFLLSYLRISLVKSNLEDIPWGWAMVIAGILGLKTWDAFIKGRVGNGTTNGEKKELPKQ